MMTNPWSIPKLTSFHNILNILLPIYEPQSRANDAQLCATRPSFP